MARKRLRGGQESNPLSSSVSGGARRSLKDGNVSPESAALEDCSDIAYAGLIFGRQSYNVTLEVVGYTYIAIHMSLMDLREGT